MRVFFLMLLCLLCGSCVRQPPAGTVRLQFYLWGETVIADLEKETIANFEKENPDIKIELTTVIGSYSEKMQALIVGGIFPDVMSVDINAYYEWADRGLLLDLGDILERAEREQHMTLMPIVREQVPYRGKTYVVPYGFCGVLPEISLDPFKTAGVPVPSGEEFTWDWVLATAPKLSRLGGNPKAQAEVFGTMPDMMSLMMTFGGKVFDDAYAPKKVLINSPETLAMVVYAKKLLAGKGVLSRLADTISSNAGTSWSMYLDGRTAWYIHGIWQTPTAWYQNYPLHWDVRPFPAGPSGLRITANGAQLLGGSAQTKYPEQVKRFLRYYLTEKSIALHTKTGAFMPVFREMLGQPRYMADSWPPSVKYYFETMEAGRSQLPVYGPGVGELRRILDTRLSQAALDNSIPVPVQMKMLEEEIYRWLDRQKKKGFYP